MPQKVTVSSRRISPRQIPVKSFVAKYSGACAECTRAIHVGDKIVAKKGKPPMHADCREWKYRARDEQLSKDGGYGVAPNFRQRRARRSTTRKNRQIDKVSVFNRSA